MTFSIELDTKDIPTGKLIKKEIVVEKEILSQINWYENVKPNSNCNVTVEIQKTNEIIFIKCKTRNELKLLCRRCNNIFSYDLTTSLKMEFNTTIHLQNIDIWDNIKEELLLNTPLHPLCKDDCKGLCPQCGCNWNIEDCIHKKQPSEKINPQFISLKKLLK